MKVKTLLIYVFIFGAGFWGWYNFTHYNDRSFNCHIKIKTDLEFNNGTIKEGLVALKRAMPEMYRVVCERVRIIETGVACGGFGGGCYYENDDNKIIISVAQGAVVEAGAIIVHETCHLIQKEQGRSLGENECYEIDDQVFRQLTQFPKL